MLTPNPDPIYGNILLPEVVISAPKKRSKWDDFWYKFNQERKSDLPKSLGEAILRAMFTEPFEVLQGAGTYLVSDIFSNNPATKPSLALGLDPNSLAGVTADIFLDIPYSKIGRVGKLAGNVGKATDATLGIRKTKAARTVVDPEEARLVRRFIESESDKLAKATRQQFPVETKYVSRMVHDFEKAAKAIPTSLGGPYNPVATPRKFISKTGEEEAELLAYSVARPREDLLPAFSKRIFDTGIVATPDMLRREYFPAGVRHELGHALMTGLKHPERLYEASKRVLDLIPEDAKKLSNLFISMDSLLGQYAFNDNFLQVAGKQQKTLEELSSLYGLLGSRLKMSRDAARRLESIHPGFLAEGASDVLSNYAESFPKATDNVLAALKSLSHKPTERKLEEVVDAYKNLRRLTHGLVATPTGQPTSFALSLDLLNDIDYLNKPFVAKKAGDDELIPYIFETQAALSKQLAGGYEPLHKVFSSPKQLKSAVESSLDRILADRLPSYPLNQSYVPRLLRLVPSQRSSDLLDELYRLSTLYSYKK